MFSMHIWLTTVVLLGLHLGSTEAQIANCGASGTLNVGQNYTFVSPNYQWPYPGGLRCRWTFSTPENSIVNLNCQTFDTRRTTSFCIDYFYYSPSGNLSSGDYIEYCGRGILNKNTTENSFDVYFTTSWWNYNPNHSLRRIHCVITALGDTIRTTPEPSTLESTPEASMPESTPDPSTPDPSTPKQTSFKPTMPNLSSKNAMPTTTVEDQSSCECGENNLQARIVGGEETEIHEWPWQVALRLRSTNQQFCGGSLISPSWILTAAHCVENIEVSQILVSIGEHDTDTGSDTSHTVHRGISQKISHSDYDGGSVINDIALIQLTSPVEYSHGISPVCLPTNIRTQLFDGENATVTGWGTTSFQGSLSNVLLEVSLPVISNELCASLYDFSIRDDQVCTYEEGKDSCQGDSGGPLVWLDDNGHYQQIGIVSYGIGCAAENSPGVYTRVSSYIDWIQQNSNTNFCS